MFPVAVVFCFDVALAFAIRIGLGITSCILHLAPGLFDLALNLLRGTFCLSPGVVGPFAGLTLGASNRIINRTLHGVFVHCSTSMVVRFLDCVELKYS